jgi:hypothetical protein
MKNFSHLYPIVLTVLAGFWALGLVFFILDNLGDNRDLDSNESQSRIAGPTLPLYPFPICH